MDVYIDLIQNPKQIKSKFWRYTAIFAIILFIGFYIVTAVLEQKKSFYFSAFFWTIWGILYLYSLITGKSLERLFGKKYIHLTETFIELKPKLNQKVVHIDWDEIESIKMKPTYLVVKSKKGDEIQIDFKVLDYLSVQNIKSAVREIVEKKKIALSGK